MLVPNLPTPKARVTFKELASILSQICPDICVHVPSPQNGVLADKAAVSSQISKTGGDTTEVVGIRTGTFTVSSSEQVIPFLVDTTVHL